MLDLTIIKTYWSLIYLLSNILNLTNRWVLNLVMLNSSMSLTISVVFSDSCNNLSSPSNVQPLGDIQKASMVISQSFGISQAALPLPGESVCTLHLLGLLLPYNVTILSTLHLFLLKHCKMSTAS